MSPSIERYSVSPGIAARVLAPLAVLLLACYPLAVYAALATLPELHRSVIAQRYLEEMDYASIEQTLGLSNGALRGILGRALAAMRKRLKTNTEVFS